MAETFLSRLSVISAIEQQEGIPRERRLVRTDDLREMVYHFNRLDEHERSEYSEFKLRLMSQRKEIEAGKALIEQQAQEIERLKGQIEFWTTSHEAICKNREYLGEEIAKKDRILTLACDMLKSAHEACNDCPIENFCDCVEDREKVCPDVWREWLEKEAEVHE